MKNVEVLNRQKSIANNFIIQLRDASLQKDSMRFRKNLERLGEVMAFEISKTLKYASIDVETPLGIAQEYSLTERIVLATILRAGLPMHAGFLNLFDDAENAFVAAYRKHHKDGSFEIESGYLSCPNIDDKVLILIDPMMATGASMELSLTSLLRNGSPKEIHFVTAIASTIGLEYMHRKFPQAKFWIGALDDELTAKSYIVPGLGDAGDLAFGSKLQE